MPGSKVFFLYLLSFLYSSLSFGQDNVDLLSHAKTSFEAGNYKQVFEYFRKSPVEPSSKMLLLVGETFWENFKYDSALAYFKSAQYSTDIQKESVILSKIGLFNIHWERKEIPEMRQLIEELEALIQAAQSDRLTGLVAFKKAEFATYYDRQKSIAHYQEARKLLEEHPYDLVNTNLSFTTMYLSVQPAEVSRLLEETGSLIQKHFPSNKLLQSKLILFRDLNLSFSSRHELAIEILEKELPAAIGKNKEDWAVYLKALALRYSGSSQQKIGNYLQAIDNYHQFTTVAIRYHKPDSFHFEEIYQALFEIYLELGDFNLALDYLERSIKITEKVNYIQKSIEASFNRGRLFSEKGQFQLAEEQFDIAIQLCDSSGFGPAFLPAIYYYKSKLSLNQEQYENAEIDIKKFIKLRKELFNWQGFRLINAYTDLSKILQRLKKNDELQELFQKTSPLIPLNRFEGNYLYIDHINQLASFLLMQGKLDSAQTYLNLIVNQNQSFIQEGSKIEENFFLGSRLVETLLLLGEYHDRKHQLNGQISDLEKAYETYKKGIQQVVASKLEFKSSRDRFWLNSWYRHAFEKVSAVTYQLYQKTADEQYLNAFFGFCEGSRSFELLQSLNRNLAIQNTNIPDTLRNQLESLKKQSRYLNNEILKINDPSSERLEALKTELTFNTSLKKSLILSLEENFPEYYEITYRTTGPSLDDVSQLLQENEALLEYSVGEKNIYILSITKQKKFLSKVPLVGNKVIQDFRNELQPKLHPNDPQIAFEKYTTKAIYLYEALLQNPLKQIGQEVDRLFIIPHKQLNYLPFELLISKESNSSLPNYQALNYLIKDFAISYGYSANLLFKKPNNQKDKVKRGSLLAFAPSYNDQPTNPNDPLLSYRDDLYPLKYNQTEVDKIAEYYKSELVKGTEAKEHIFLQKAKNYDILHLAMHALVDNQRSNYSRLAFNNEITNKEDNYLHNFELYNMQLNARLAVLSACNSGHGSLIAGEGVMSLARAFTYAGVPSVVMSQWQVEDQASSEIISDFYRFLAEGNNKDQALRLAKLAFLKNAPPEKHHPFFWSNFVALGNMEPILPKQSTWWYYLISGVALAILILFFKRTVS